MGACFNDMTLDGKLTQKEVSAQFNARCEQDGYECGHSYSGSFSQFEGLRFTGKEFLTIAEANDWVEEHGEKWGPAVCVRHKVYKVPTSAIKHTEKRRELEKKIQAAEMLLRDARTKARINNRSTTPAYVTKAEAKLETVKKQVQPKIDERNAKIKTLMTNAAAKSKKSVWYLGGWCSS